MQAFPNPSNSPAHHTRTLSISGVKELTVATTHAWGWVCSFRRITDLLVMTVWWDDRRVSLAQLHGLSPTLKSLCLDRSFLPLSEIFNLIHSFPLLKDLAVRTYGPSINDTWDTKGTLATSPKFTGTLQLMSAIPSVVCRLLDLPGGLHFTKIVVGCPVGDAESAMGLVSRCSGTLESLSLHYFLCYHPSVDPLPLDLSKATKLKDLEFRWGSENIQWITTVLQTVKSENLEKIRIIIGWCATFDKPVEGAVRQEWRKLDRFLVGLWSSRSVRSDIRFEEQEGGGDIMGDIVPVLLPESSKEGFVGMGE